MMNVQELAALAIQVLDTQKAYFKSRDHQVLLESKRLEKLLREEALTILSDQESLGI